MKDESLINAPPHRFITETSVARQTLESLQTEKIVGLDTETYWDVQTKCNRLSLAQIATQAREVFVFDALAVDVETLRPFVESPEILMVAHNARFDEMILRGAGLFPVGFIDTLRMAHMSLSLPSYSLASVTEHLFGTPLDKTLQRSNWRRRPLTASQLSYAAKDAWVTLRVYEELSRRLDMEGRLEEVLKISTIVARDTENRPTRRRRVPQVPSVPLTPEEKRIVVRLKGWRLARANEQRRPAYMICPDKTLEHLARERPATLEALRSIHGLGETKIERFGTALLEALREALGSAQGET